VFGTDNTGQIEARDKPLTGITVDRDPGGGDMISILIGGELSDHAGHVIHAPVKVTLKETPEGAHEALEIESRDGTTTRISFRSVMPVELVDGVLL
jgi:hypothetical protein